MTVTRRWTAALERRPAAAVASGFAGDDHGGLRLHLVAEAAAAIVLLLVAAPLSVFKPAGRTRYGRRKLRRDR